MFNGKVMSYIVISAVNRYLRTSYRLVLKYVPVIDWYFKLWLQHVHVINHGSINISMHIH